MLNVAGSFFPAWMVAMVLGVALTVAVRDVFAAARLEPHLGSPASPTSCVRCFGRSRVPARRCRNRLPTGVVELLPLFDDYFEQTILPRL